MILRLTFAARFTTVLLLLSGPVVGTALAQDFNSQNLWNASIGGYETYRIPGIVVTKHGTVLAYAAARQTIGSDWANTDIVLRRSTDEGRTFSPSKRIAGTGHGTTDNPTAIADRKTGAVYMVYQVDYARCYVMRSTDDGKSFAKPIEITSALVDLRSQFDWNVVAPGPNHGIQTRNGRLIVPVWLAAGKPTASGRRPHAPSALTTLYSDDHGATWHHGDLLLINDSKIPNPSEADIVELSNGRIMLNIRNASTKNRRAVTVSPNGATGWSKPVLDDALFEPICDAGLIALPPRSGGREALAFSNPNSSTMKQVAGRTNYPRQRLTIRLSYDNGKTWPVAKLIDPGVTGYSDLAVLPDGTILCLYESGGINGNESDAAHLTLAHFDTKWIEEASSR